jgi:copper transport protein
MRLRHTLLTGLVVLAASLALASAAQAHALLLRSVPAADAEMSQPPPAIELWFTEPLEAGFSSARLLDSTGAEVDTGAALVDPADDTHLTLPVGQLGPGIYTVAWQSLSQVDGHEWFGSFPFTVLNPDGTRPSGTAAAAGAAGRGELPTPAEVLARWLSLLGGMLLFGVPLFRLLAGSEASHAHTEARALAASLSPLAVSATLLAVALLILGTWGQLTVQALRLGGLGQLPEVVQGTRTGLLALARQLPTLAALWVVSRLPLPAWLKGRQGVLRALGAVAVVAGAGLLAWSALPDDWWLLAGRVLLIVAAYVLACRSQPWLALMVLAAGALTGFSATSHAAAVAGRGWAMLSDYIHLVAAGAWLGGLLLMPWLLWHERARLRQPEARLALWRLARRYSYLAAFSIFVLGVSGLFNSLVQLPDAASLWTTAYGRVLLLKLAVLAVALLFALLNNRLLHGRRQRPPEVGQALALQRQVAVEAVTALALMLTVAVLVQTPTPRFMGSATAAQPELPFNTLLTADDLFIHAQVSPNKVGDNRFWLHLYHEAGTPIGEVQLVRLRFNYRDAQLGQASVDLTPLGRGTFEAQGAYLSQAGNWDVEVYVRRRGLDDALTQFGLSVPPPAGQTTGASAWINPVPAIPGLILAALALLALGLAPMIWRRPLEAAGPRVASTTLIGGGVLLVLALGLSAAGAPAWRDRILVQQALTRTNPIPDTPESRAHGQSLYEANCLPCHGPVGLGDGPLALTLRPPPANLQVHMVPGVHTDAQIFDWITNGYPASPMPAFKDVLTEDERWHVLNYIRTLVPE